MKIMSVFGTRPEAIKMAPLVHALAADAVLDSKVVVTAQHREMLDQVLQCFDIHPDYDLNIMRHGQTLADITSTALKGLMGIIEQDKPQLLLVHGDTTTTFAGALAAFYQKIPCGHVEAGLRTGDKYAPYPEEMNRCLTGVLADYHFAPTESARENLLHNGVQDSRIVVTGNTVIDALLATVKKPCHLTGLGLERVDWQKKVVLLTCHRRENWGQPMAAIFTAIARIAREYPEIQIIYPVHKNPLVLQTAQEKLGGESNVILTEPLEYQPFCQVMSRCYMVLTDSGGLQEEAPALGKPVLVLREVTERPEAIAAGTAKLAGNTEESVYRHFRQLLEDKKNYDKMAHAANPYGDGKASARIVAAIKNWFGEI